MPSAESLAGLRVVALGNGETVIVGRSGACADITTVPLFTLEALLTREPALDVAAAALVRAEMARREARG